MHRDIPSDADKLTSKQIDRYQNEVLLHRCKELHAYFLALNIGGFERGERDSVLREEEELLRSQLLPEFAEELERWADTVHRKTGDTLVMRSWSADNPSPVWLVLRQLVQASEYLLTCVGYDRLGYENIDLAIRSARQHLADVGISTLPPIAMMPPGARCIACGGKRRIPVWIGLANTSPTEWVQDGYRDCTSCEMPNVKSEDETKVTFGDGRVALGESILPEGFITETKVTLGK